MRNDKNKGIRLCSQCSFFVTKVKVLRNKVLKTLFSKKTIVTKKAEKNQTIFPYFANQI